MYCVYVCLCICLSACVQNFIPFTKTAISMVSHDMKIVSFFLIFNFYLQIFFFLRKSNPRPIIKNKSILCSPIIFYGFSFQYNFCFLFMCLFCFVHKESKNKAKILNPNLKLIKN